MIKVKLNDLNYRYDVYQIINLFYDFEDIKFVDNNYDFYININDGKIVCSNNKVKKEYEISEDIKVKEQVKKSVFLFFEQLTKKEIAWGTLIGIRPTKLTLSLLNKGKTKQKIVEYFKNKNFTRKDKVELCVEIAKYEKDIVNTQKKNISVYIDMPFCPTRCLYCSFTSNPIGGKNKNLINQYINCLAYEIDKMSEFINRKNLNIQCVYFGGGTPTSVNNEQFAIIMEKIYNGFIKKHSVEEFTVECGRPDSITEEKLLTMKKFKVDRISINPQTMNNDTLNLIGRMHTVEDINNKFNLARKLGFNNINMDIIVGLPFENLDKMKKTCKKLKELKPDSITIHGLALKRGSKLHEDYLLGCRTLDIDSEEINKMYDEAVKACKELDMKPYYMYRQKNMVGNIENVGYSKSSKEGLYNIQMIEERQTIIALGADAVSKVIFLDEDRIERFANVKDVREYVNRVEEMVDKKIKLLETLYEEE